MIYGRLCDKSHDVRMRKFGREGKMVSPCVAALEQNLHESALCDYVAAI